MKGTWFVGLVIAVVAAACDSRATAEQNTVRTEQKSAEYESCGASMHCKDNLRCFDSVCRRQVRSTVGDYYAALGAGHRAKGELEQAIAAYNQSLGQYGAEKVDLPPEIDCAYGAVLAAAKHVRKEHAELGARVLHRCVLAVPVGSRLRDEALAHLTTLADVGLDHMLLGPAKTADLYLTKAPSRPSTDKLAITVSASPQPTGKTYAQIPEALTGPALRAPLIACWEAYSDASKKDVLASTIGIKSSYIASDYEDVPGSYSVKLDAAPNFPPGPDATADACVRGVVESTLKGMKITDSFTTKLTLTIK